jgi:hypothetical protein
MYVRGYLQGSENGRVVTIGDQRERNITTGLFGLQFMLPMEKSVTFTGACQSANLG